MQKSIRKGAYRPGEIPPAVEKEDKDMKLTWLGHACFLLESGGYEILLDPFKGVPGLADIAGEADAVYCSHGHFDHACTEGVTLRAGKPSPFAVSEVAAFHDEKGGALRGENVLRRFTAEGISVVHAGDLGHQLTAEQAAALMPCDVLLIPVGGTYTVDAAGAKTVAEMLQARVVVPMHYRKGAVGFENIGTLEQFTDLWPAETVHFCPDNTLTLTEDLPEMVAVPAIPDNKE